MGLRLGRSADEVMDSLSGAEIAEYAALFEVHADERAEEQAAAERRQKRDSDRLGRSLATLGGKSDGGAMSVDEYLERNP